MEKPNHGGGSTTYGVCSRAIAAYVGPDDPPANARDVCCMVTPVNPAALANPNLLWEALIGETGCAVFVTSRDGEILFANGRSRAWIGWRRQGEDLQRPPTLADTCAPALYEERLAIVQRVCDENIAVVFESISRSVRCLVSVRALPGAAGGRVAMVLARRLHPWERVTPEAFPHATVIEVERHDPGVIATLSPRELDVLILIGEGLSSGDIAKRLHRSVRTIERHRDRLGQKLGVSNRVDIARFAMRAGLAELPEPADAALATKPGYDVLAISEPLRKISRRRIRKAD
ncbi:MAG TPA: LuxR C-terminal-related transcriptional regulator [Phycisphaerales bacterium]|nr:LuxR C-terminal-related transcriptional regulator [Phycisphaerales bacterium]